MMCEIATSEMHKRAVNWLIDVAKIPATKLADFLCMKLERRNEFILAEFPECYNMFIALCEQNDPPMIALYKVLLLRRQT